MTNQVEPNSPLSSKLIAPVLDASFLGLVFSLAFMRPNVELSGLALQVTDLLFLITATAYVFAFLSRRVRFRIDRAYIVFGLYAAALVLSASFSENQGFSFLKLLGEIYLIGLAVLTANTVRSIVGLRRVIFVWLAASTISAFIGAIAAVSFYAGSTNLVTVFALHNYGTLSPGDYPRLQGTFEYPSILCNYLTVSLVMLFAARSLGWISKRLFVVLGALFSLAIAFTVTPGVGGACFAVLILVSRLFPTKTSLSSALRAAGVFSMALFLFISAFAVIGISVREPATVGGISIPPAVRLLTWKGAINTFTEHPLCGKGLGLPVASVAFTAVTGEGHLLTDAHNTFLSIAGQAGVLGLITLTLVCVTVIRRAISSESVSPVISSMRSCLRIAFVSAFICQGLVGSFEDSRHLWVLIGLILALSNMSKASDETA
jgi:O-antigen ligase